MARFLRTGLLGIVSFGILFFGLWLFSLLAGRHQNNLSVRTEEVPIIKKANATDHAPRIEHLQNSKISPNSQLSGQSTATEANDIEITSDNQNKVGANTSSNDVNAKSQSIANTKPTIEIQSDVKNSVPPVKNDTNTPPTESAQKNEPGEEVVVMGTRNRQSRNIDSLEKASKGNKIIVRVPRRE